MLQQEEFESLPPVLKEAPVMNVLNCFSVKSIDPMHKWRQFKYSFVYIQISPTSLLLGNIFF